MDRSLPWLARLAGRTRLRAVSSDFVIGPSTSNEIIIRKNSNAIEPPIGTENAGKAAEYLSKMLTGWMVRSDEEKLPEPTPRPEKPAVPRPATPPVTVATHAVISRRSLDERTSALVKKLGIAESASSRLLRTEELCHHLIEYPQTRTIAVKEGALSMLIGLGQRTSDEGLKAQIRMCLSLCGYVSPPKARGVRLLSIDGGGTRGIMALEILEALEAKLEGRKICEVFDMFVGVSTGAIIGSLLFACRLSVQRCKELYREIATMFNCDRLKGVRGLITSHSYYDSENWKKVLQKNVGDQTMIGTATLPQTPKVCFLSAIITEERKLAAFAFRNYNHPPGRDSVYKGSCKYPIWQALQASSAAPLYLEEVKIDEYIHQDGGVLLNNPCAIGMHESNVLWPDTPTQCVLSIGNGRMPQLPGNGEPQPFTSLQEKINIFIESATDTELTHMLMNDLLGSNVYYRLNPYMSQRYTLDTAEPEKLDQMQVDAQMYLRKNQTKLQSLANNLMQQRSLGQKIGDCIRHQSARFLPARKN